MTVSSINGAGKLDCYMQRMKLDCFLTLYTKMYSKWITDWNVRPKTIKLLEENIGSTSFDLSLSNIFFGISLLRQGKQKLK